MNSSEIVSQFVKEALSAGHSRTEIESQLETAGWSAREVSQALSGFAENEFSPPVPKPRPQLNARDAFVYLILFTALGFAAGYLIALVNSILNIQLPDPGDSKYLERRSFDTINWAIAVLLFAGPVYLWMTYYTRKQIASDAGHKRSLVRKWLTYLALFVTAMFFLGDGVFVIYTFLDGEVTLRFLLKALTVAVVNLAIFVFYLRDVEEA